MSQSTDRLRARRAALLARAGLQREEWCAHVARIAVVADRADGGLRLARRFATPPVLVAGGVAAALLLGRGRGRQALGAGLAILGLVLRVRSVGQLLSRLTGGSPRAQVVNRSR